MTYSLDWAYAYGKPTTSADFKATADDFQVHEFFAKPFSGEGEHTLIKVEKRNVTTEDVVQSLAQQVNKPRKVISYAGLKDKHAHSTQWLSIHTPGQEINNLKTLQGPGWRILESTRHHKKLKPGFLAGNHFTITLRNVLFNSDFMHRIEQIKAHGVPNYFGEQRFGVHARNLIRAEQLLVQRQKVADKFLKGMYFSTARAWLYNLIVSARVHNHIWNKPLIGDVMQLAGSHSVFINQDLDPTLLARIEAKDVSPASPLAGRSTMAVFGEASDIIHHIYNQWTPWLSGLIHYGLEEAWRANILHVQQLEYAIYDNQLILSFSLPAGAYATTVLRELVCY